MHFLEIDWQSGRYQEALKLRDRILRAPLGIEFGVDELAAEKQQWHFGIVNDDQVLVACIVAVPLSPELAKLRQMAVDDGHQRQGIGARLLIETEMRLADRGVRSIELNARESATDFYRKMGYQIAGERFIEVTIPHFKMTKQLPSSPTANGAQ